MVCWLKSWTCSASQDLTNHNGWGTQTISNRYFFYYYYYFYFYFYYYYYYYYYYYDYYDYYDYDDDDDDDYYYYCNFLGILFLRNSHNRNQDK